ncbi:ATP-binding protein, partial [Geodermatophilus sp. CPCC 205506]|uniref:ATP-binding protein n=1 Tax=Geodermatophilus sp. CPCC 205506 TaxID=2936596 RepID=UPI003EEBC05B
MRTAPPAADGFVGRDAELTELTAGVAAAAAGAGGLLLVSGPAGIGKTRTVEVAAARAPAVAWGRCVDDPGAPPLWPWRRAMRSLPAVRAAVDGALTGGDRPADPEAARFALVAAATEALVEAAGPHGLVVVLEDLHWADETSLRLLRHLAAELHRSHLLVVATYREPSGAPDGSPLDRALPELLRCPGTRPVPLPPLTEDDVRALLPGAGLETVRAAHRRSGGNPLYLRAVARAGPGTADGADPGTELRRLVRTTLTGLPPAVLDLVDTAAVLGEEVDAARLAAVTARPPGEVAAGLDAAVRAGVLTAVPDAPGRRRFAHAVVRDAVYADLAPSTREELHRRAAEALERLGGDDDTGAGVVAGHWLRAASEPGTLRRASSWARRAAAAATRSLAFDEAARFLGTALAAADRAGPDAGERAGLLLELATAEYRAGRFGESLQHATAASDAAAACGRPDLLAAAALTVHDVAAPGSAPAVVRLCERALASPALVDPAVRARLLAQTASVLADAGRLGTAAAHAEEALALAEATGDPEAVLDAVRARVKAGPGALAPGERLRLGLLAIEHAAATGQPLAELWGAKWRIDAALGTGDLPTVHDELARVTALAQRTRLPLVRWHDLRLRASVEALYGRFADALVLNEEAREVGSRELAQDASTAGLSDAFLLEHALVTGSTSPWHGDGPSRLARADDVPVVLVTRVLIALHRDGREAAAPQYERLRPHVREPGFVSAEGVASNLTRLVVAFGDADVAGELHDRIAAHPVVAGGAGVYCCGSLAVELGRLDVVRGRGEEAIGHFEEALALDSRTGARPAVVHDRVELAAALLARGRPADLARAGELARTACADARRL